MRAPMASGILINNAAPRPGAVAMTGCAFAPQRERASDEQESRDDGASVIGRIGEISPKIEQRRRERDGQGDPENHDAPFCVGADVQLEGRCLPPLTAKASSQVSAGDPPPQRFSPVDAGPKGPAAASRSGSLALEFHQKIRAK